MKKITQLVYRTYWILLLAFLTMPVIVFGTNHTPSNLGGSNTPGFKITNPLKFDTLESLFEGVLRFIAGLGAILSVLFFIYSGFLFVTAMGDEKKLEKAKNVFTYTVIGTILLVAASLIATVLKTTIESISGGKITF